MADDGRLEAMMAELARQDAALAAFEGAIAEVGRQGAIEVPEGFLRELDEACEVRATSGGAGHVWLGIRG